MIDFYSEKLKENWGDKADAMDCKAYVRLYDEMSRWQSFIYAMNPEDEDSVMALICAESIQACEVSMQHLLSCYNKEGTYVIVDGFFRPQAVREIYKKLMRKNEG